MVEFLCPVTTVNNKANLPGPQPRYADLAANWITTITSEMARSDTLPKFVGTTAINMPGSIAKDQALTKLFGVVGGASRVPAASFALFTVRDLATMAAAFTLPTPMSAKVRAPWAFWERRRGDEKWRYDIHTVNTPCTTSPTPFLLENP